MTTADPAPETMTPWLRSAVVKTLAGTLLGLITSTVIVGVAFAFFPSLLDVDYDLGLAFERWGREYLTPASQGFVPEATNDSYVFVDVDPQEPPGADEKARGPAVHAMCAALLEARLAPPGAALNCSPARPLNRYALAELIKAARTRKAGLIVLDVDLSADDGVVLPQEDEYLRDVIWGGAPDAAKVVFVRDAEYLGRQQQTDSDVVLLKPSKAFEAPSPNARGAMAAVALPGAGELVRRYPKCYHVANHGDGMVPSLPYVAAMLLQHPGAAINALCEGQDTKPASAGLSPRIHYSLPTLRAHQDDRGEGDDFRTWSLYRQIYNRCWAASFWNANSPCGRADYVTGKTVVIGASNRLRKDRHFTPLGNMAGAEVVINATRSFARHPDEQDKPFVLATKKKVLLVLSCVPIWLAFYSIREYLHRWPTRKRSIWARLGEGMIVMLGFWLALWAVVAVSLATAFASFSMLVAVLAIAVEQYVEVVTTWVIHPFEQWLKHLLRMRKQGQAH
jgi:hypothetical protein